MKHFYFIIIALFAFVTSCSKPTKEELIEKAFIEYVNQNFDDPSHLKEVVSIEVQDTAKKVLLEIFNSVHHMDSLLSYCDSTFCSTDAINSFMESLTKDKRKFNNLSYYKQEKIREVAYKYIDCALSKTMYNKKNYTRKLEILDSTFNAMSIPEMLLYNVRARVTKNNELKLNTYYALVDSLNIRIYDKEPAFAEYSTEIGLFKEALDDFLSEHTLYKEKIDNIMDATERLKESYREAGIFVQ